MKLVLGDTIASRNPQDTYVLCLKVVFGDDDGFQTVEVLRCPNDEFDLEELYQVVKTIERCKVIYDEDELLEAIKGTKLEKLWPRDPGDYTIPGMYESHWIRYFDKSGVEYSVKVES